ncbi:MAG: nucleotide exchange factor GrpE, partial [Candidatus Acidiferrales bacterium]
MKWPNKESSKIDINVNVDRGAAPAAASAPVDPANEQGSDLNERDMAEQLAKLLAEKQELQDTLLRRQADFDNYRKRIERDRQQENRRLVNSLVEELLPVLDAFDRAIASHDDPAYAEYSKGVELIRKRFWDVLAKQGLQHVDSVGKEFDPHVHHAIEKVETTKHPDGTVLEELQAGYKLHDRVIRPAMVRVASNP